MSETLVVVGAGHGAGQLIASLRQKKYTGRIVVYGDESHYPYQRPPLSKKFLAGELPAERLYVKPPAFYEDPGVDMHLGVRIESIDRDAKTVTDTQGNVTAYDKLLLSTGTRVRPLEAPGVDLPGVHYLRSIDNVSNMQDRLREGARIVIVGAGYIGLEVAAVARSLGLDVTVLEMADRVMSRVVSPQVSAFYEQEHRSHGVRLMLQTHLSRFTGDERLEGVELADGTVLPADLALIGIGVIPNAELAANAGLATDNGIVVDNRCRTADPNVFAIGDCTNHPNDLLGHRLRLESVHNALEQAKTAAANICGEDNVYAQVPWFWSDQYDIKLQIAGLSMGYDDVVIRGDVDSRSFSCAYLRDGRLIALDAINSPRDFMQSKALIASGAAIPKERLADTGMAQTLLRYEGNTYDTWQTPACHRHC